MFALHIEHTINHVVLKIITTRDVNVMNKQVALSINL